MAATNSTKCNCCGAKGADAKINNCSCAPERREPVHLCGIIRHFEEKLNTRAQLPQLPDEECALSVAILNVGISSSKKLINKKPNELKAAIEKC
jgi:hypothetical protein